MKKTMPAAFIGLCTLGAFIAISCTNPFSGDHEKKAAPVPAEAVLLTVTIGSPGASASRTIVPDASDLPVIAAYELTMTCAGQTTKTVTYAAPTLTGSIALPVAGTWTVTVIGKTAGGSMVASGSSVVDIAAFSPASVTITLAYLPADDTHTGSMSITLIFPKSLGIDSVDASVDGIPIDPELQISDNGDTNDKVVCVATSVGTAAPLVRISLKKNDAVLLTWVERVWVFRNITTTNSTVLPASSFNTAPEAPSNLAAELRDNGTVRLSWPHMEIAESFTLERSENNGPEYIIVAAAIGAGTLEYVDSDIAFGNTYEYRLSATNAFGTSGSTLSAPVVVVTSAVAPGISGVTSPVLGVVPVTTITGTAQYTGTVSWSPTVIGTFAGSTSYTATITLTARNGYTLTGVTADFFTVAGSTSVTNPADSGVISAVFPATALAGPTDTESVAAAKDALSISFASGDSATAVTQNLTLPVAGSNGTTITWSSSNPAIAANGTVTRPDAVDASGDLTATITKGGASVTLIIALTVKATGTSGITVNLPTAPAATALVFQNEGSMITSFMVERGTPVTIATTFEGSTYDWYMDGSTATVSTTSSYVIDGALYATGNHTLFVDVLSGGRYYSGRINFTVIVEMELLP